MSSQKSQKNKREKKRQKESPAFYVYCIGEHDVLAPLFKEAALPIPIESEGRLDLVIEGKLAAVTSPVPLEDYNEDALQTRLADAAWVAARAMRHEKVVEHFAARASVIPLRFGSIYLERTRIEQMLSQRKTELQSILERLRGREEWGLNVLCDRAKLTESIAQLSPRLRELNEQAASASPGQSYLIRKKIDAMRADEARAETKRIVAEIERSLAATSDGAVRLRMIHAEATEHGEVISKLTFLVARSRFDEFRAAAERLAQEHREVGIRLELTGPWPAYNFAANNW